MKDDPIISELLQLRAENAKLRKREGEMNVELAKLRWRLNIPSVAPVAGHPRDGWDGPMVRDGQDVPVVFEPRPDVPGPVRWGADGRVRVLPTEATIESMRAQLDSLMAEYGPPPKKVKKAKGKKK